jgi:hypothetical protein
MMSLFDSDISQDEQAVRKAAFEAILSGEAITQDGLVVATGFTREKVNTLVLELTMRGLLVLEPESDQIVGSWGLSSIPTTHELIIRGRTLHTWCAVDSVGIPAGLGEDASIVSKCHSCGVTVNIEMTARCTAVGSS